MKQVNIIFTHPITPRDSSFNGGEPFTEVTFEKVLSVDYHDGFVHVEFSDGVYSYNNTTVSRVRVKSAQ